MKKTLAMLVVLAASCFSKALTAQQAPTGLSVQRDQPALDVLRQTIASAGGANAIQAVRSILATGTITYYTDTPLTGTVTVRCQGAEQYRMDATLQDGVRTLIADGGGEVLLDTNGAIRTVAGPDIVSKRSLVLPYTTLLAAIHNPTVSVVDLGEVTHDGLSVRDVRVQRIYAGKSDPQGLRSAATARDYLISASSFQILAILDTPTPSSVASGSPIFTHEVQLSGYQAVGGALAASTFLEIVNGQQLSKVTLTDITPNATFSDAD